MITPRRHELQYGEGLAWAPPDETARFFVWHKTAGGDDGAPRWMQTHGFDVAQGAEILIAGASTRLTVGSSGVTAEWQTLIADFDGFDPVIAQVTAQDHAGQLLTLDRFALPSPNSSDAATIAAQERRLLQQLIVQREALALTGGHVKVTDPSGTSLERADLAAVDRRVAEVRARVAWFEQAAAGNSMPRLEIW